MSRDFNAIHFLNTNLNGFSQEELAVLRHLRQRGVVFHLLGQDPTCHPYLSMALAEGFQELGIPHRANHAVVDQADPTHAVFNVDTSRVPAPALVICDMAAAESRIVEYLALVDNMRSLTTPVVLLCLSDYSPGLHFPDYPPVFITHEVARWKSRGTRIPWAFGLSGSVCRKISLHAKPGPRKRVFIRNFRPSHNQQIRLWLDRTFVKPLSEHYEIDRQTAASGHYRDDYYAQLGSAFGCLAYGGTLSDPVLRREGRDPALDDEKERDYPFVDRWDNWRFWESLAAGCLTVALDFDAYGLKLPVVPENGRHYIGLQFDRLHEAVEQLTKVPEDRLTEIAKAGQEWVLKHYTPRPVAERFVRVLTALGILKLEL